MSLQESNYSACLSQWPPSFIYLYTTNFVRLFLFICIICCPCNAQQRCLQAPRFHEWSGIWHTHLLITPENDKKLVPCDKKRNTFTWANSSSDSTLVLYFFSTPNAVFRAVSVEWTVLPSWSVSLLLFCISNATLIN